MPTLGLVAGVGEQQGAHGRIEPRHQLLVHAQAQVAAPGEAVDRIGQQRADCRSPLDGGGDDARRVTAHANGRPGSLLQVADGGADRPGAKAGPQGPQPAEAELGLHAPLAAHQLVPLVKHHRLELTEQLRRLGIGQQHAQGFRRGDQDLGRRAQLLAAFMAAGVAVADRQAQGPAHGPDRCLDGQGQVAAEGPQGGEIEEAQAFGSGAWLLRGPARFFQHLRNRTHHGGVGLAGAGGHLDQAAFAGQIGLPGLALERHRRPALLGEPGFDGGKTRAGENGSPGSAHSALPLSKPI